MGKDELEKGMHVRARWNAAFRISKAIIVEVNSDIHKVNALFGTLDGIRNSEVIRSSIISRFAILRQYKYRRDLNK